MEKILQEAQDILSGKSPANRIMVYEFDGKLSKVVDKNSILWERWQRFRSQLGIPPHKD